MTVYKKMMFNTGLPQSNIDVGYRSDISKKGISYYIELHLKYKYSNKQQFILLQRRL